MCQTNDFSSLLFFTKSYGLDDFLKYFENVFWLLHLSIKKFILQSWKKEKSPVHLDVWFGKIKKNIKRAEIYKHKIWSLPLLFQCVNWEGRHRS